jgi:UDP-N-acetylglucosamine 2-epimerase (non-hydrolysing)
LKLIDVIAGARPNFMKIAPIISAINARIALGSELRYRLVHTGQHYDSRMSGEFFRQLGIPEPNENLEVGSGTHAEQASAIMTRYERLQINSRCDLCLVVGDVTSTMACAISAQKLCIPVAHVEAGIRSGDWTMPEEINRMITDAITNWFFTTSEVANMNLQRSGVEKSRIFFVGNTMIDTLLKNMNRLQKPYFWDSLHLNSGEYFVLTLHRPVNVDKAEGFAVLLNNISQGSRGLPVIFPAHPRTLNTLRNLNEVPNNIYLVDPQPYLEFNYLVKNAKAVITDSGGVTEETTVLGVPCLTLRDSTERPETVTIGTNELVGTQAASLRSAFDKLFAGKWKKGAIPERWDGFAGERIVQVLEQLLINIPTQIR